MLGMTFAYLYLYLHLYFLVEFVFVFSFVYHSGIGIAQKCESLAPSAPVGPPSHICLPLHLHTCICICIFPLNLYLYLYLRIILALKSPRSVNPWPPAPPSGPCHREYTSDRIQNAENTSDSEYMEIQCHRTECRSFYFEVYLTIALAHRKSRHFWHKV